MKNKSMIENVFEGQSVRAVLDDQNQPWFVAKDVCEILGLENHRQVTSDFDEDEKGVSTMDTLGGPQDIVTVSEAGLYHLIFKSRKEAAIKFRKWVTGKILPALRKQGSFGAEKLIEENRTLREILEIVDGTCTQKVKFQAAQMAIHDAERAGMEGDTDYVRGRVLYYSRIMSGPIKEPLEKRFMLAAKKVLALK